MKNVLCGHNWIYVLTLNFFIYTLTTHFREHSSKNSQHYMHSSEAQAHMLFWPFLIFTIFTHFIFGDLKNIYFSESVISHLEKEQNYKARDTRKLLCIFLTLTILHLMILTSVGISQGYNLETKNKTTKQTQIHSLSTKWKKHEPANPLFSLK